MASCLPWKALEPGLSHCSIICLHLPLMGIFCSFCFIVILLIGIFDLGFVSNLSAWNLCLECGPQGAMALEGLVHLKSSLQNEALQNCHAFQSSLIFDNSCFSSSVLLCCVSTKSILSLSKFKLSISYRFHIWPKFWFHFHFHTCVILFAPFVSVLRLIVHFKMLHNHTDAFGSPCEPFNFCFLFKSLRIFHSSEVMFPFLLVLLSKVLFVCHSWICLTEVIAEAI